MDRRDFLTAGKAKRKAPAHPEKIAFSTPYRTLSGINPYNGAWGTNEVIHLLKRTMFGAKKTDVDYFVTRTILIMMVLFKASEELPIKNGGRV